MVRKGLGEPVVGNPFLHTIRVDEERQASEPRFAEFKDCQDLCFAGLTGIFLFVNG